MNEFKQKIQHAKAPEAIGWLLIFIGIIGLIGNLIVRSWWDVFLEVIAAFFNIVVPASMLCLGIYLVWAWRRGLLQSSLDHSVGLARSRTDSRLTGVCGGIARHYGIDSTAVRVVVMLLFVASPPLMLFVYLILTLVLPSA